MNERFPPNEQSVFVDMRRQIALTPLPDLGARSLRERLTARPRLVASGFGALIAVFAAILATGVFTNPPPAFAVTTTADTVTITLNDVGALDSLNAELADENIPIRAVPMTPGCTATAQEVGANGQAGAPQTIEAGTASAPIGSMTIELGQQVAPDDTLIVGISSDGYRTLFPRTISGPIPSCIGESTPIHPGS